MSQFLPDVRTYAGVPPVGAFASILGTPIVINTVTNTPYYLAPGDVVTSLGGGGGGFTNPMTTLGDLIAGSTAGAAIRLGVGSAGNVLTVVGGAPAWAAATGGGIAFTFSSTAPVSPHIGDLWVESTSGIRFEWVNDGTSTQWVEF